MLKSYVEFKDEGGFMSVWSEDDKPPFKDLLIGSLRKDDEHYYRFHPARKVVMTCKHLRVVMYKIAELNK